MALLKKKKIKEIKLQKMDFCPVVGDVLLLMQNNEVMFVSMFNISFMTPYVLQIHQKIQTFEHVEGKLL